MCLIHLSSDKPEEIFIVYLGHGNLSVLKNKNKQSECTSFICSIAVCLLPLFFFLINLADMQLWFTSCFPHKADWVWRCGFERQQSSVLQVESGEWRKAKDWSWRVDHVFAKCRRRKLPNGFQDKCALSKQWNKDGTDLLYRPPTACISAFFALDLTVWCEMCSAGCEPRLAGANVACLCVKHFPRQQPVLCQVGSVEGFLGIEAVAVFPSPLQMYKTKISQ